MLLLRLQLEEKMLQDGRNIEKVQTLDFLELVFGEEFGHLGMSFRVLCFLQLVRFRNFCLKYQHLNIYSEICIS